jgi:protein gp37
VTTTIEWTEETWNPTVGCSRVSPGCDGCYAIGVAHRAMQPAHEGLTIKRPGERTDWTGEVRCLPERLDVPLRQRKPTTYFVDSMSDLFHPDVPDGFIADVFAVMGLARHHTFQVLTKRPQRMATLLGDVTAWLERLDQATLRRAAHSDEAVRIFADFVSASEYPPPWWWLGTSIESDRYVLRADHLRATSAAVRFLSLEPLLGPLPSLDLTGIDWVIVGGESGPGARPMHPAWVREIRDRCVAAGVPFFFKQWGKFAPLDSQPGPYADSLVSGHVGYNGEWSSPTAKIWAHPWPVVMAGFGKKAAGRVLDGRTWDEMPVRVP